MFQANDTQENYKANTSQHPALNGVNIGDILTITPPEPVIPGEREHLFLVSRLALNGCMGDIIEMENGEITASWDLGVLFNTDEGDLWFLKIDSLGLHYPYEDCHPVEVTNITKAKAPVLEEPKNIIGLFDMYVDSDGDTARYVFIEGDPVCVKLENGDWVDGVYAYEGDRGDVMTLRRKDGTFAGTLTVTDEPKKCRICATSELSDYSKHRATCDGYTEAEVIAYKDSSGRFVDNVERFHADTRTMSQNTAFG